MSLNEPSIPSIGENQQAFLSTQEKNSSQLPSIASVLAASGISSPINIPQAATSTVHAPTPHLPTNRTSAPLEMRSVTEGTAMDKKRARTHNNWSSVANSINGVISAQKNKHIETVTHQVTTIMNAQQQIDNANQIINAPKGTYSDADIKNATSVRDKNMSLTNRMLEDKATRKNVQKAFDVSFTDPTKNDTPEVKAMIAARTEFEKSKQSGLNVDNPEEQRVQTLANGGSAPNTGAANNQQNVDSAHKSGLNVRGVDTPRETAGTSYADQFMKQIPTQMTQNPAYAAALKQREEQMKAAQKIAPSVINATERLEANTANNIQRAQIEKDRETNAVKIEGIKARAAMSRTMATVHGAMDRLHTRFDHEDAVVYNKNTSPDAQVKILNTQLKNAYDANKLLEGSILNMTTARDAAVKRKDTPDVIQKYNRNIHELETRYAENNARIKSTGSRLGELEKGGHYGNITDGDTNNDHEENTTDGDSTGSDENSDDEVHELIHHQ